MISFLNQMHQRKTWFLESAFVQEVSVCVLCVHVCVRVYVCMCACMCASTYTYICVCLPLRLFITNGVMWLFINLIWLVNKLYNFIAIVSVISRRVLRIKVHCKNYPSKNKHKPLLLLLYIHSATEFLMCFLFDEKNFIVIIMHSKWWSLYSSAYRWIVNTFTLTKFSLKVVHLVNLVHWGPVWHTPSQSYNGS